MGVARALAVLDSPGILSSYMLEPGAGVRIADRYELSRKLGEGGMGSVWAALDTKLRREVAVKLVTERIAESERALARFEREAMAVARLRSPYIAQVYDYGVEDGSPYIIMELLEGQDLKAKLSGEGSLDIIETAKVVVQACKALHTAHHAGVVHRDLKPANIFVADEGGEEVAKVFDFGVAKALNDLADDTETTAEGVLLGTPKYMSPEQAHGAREVDHRTDLWAMAVIAYACLTGRLPFEGTGTGEILVKICTQNPPMPSDIHDGVPLVVDEFFEKALAKDPTVRFQDAKAFAQAFAELAEVSLSTFSLKGKLGSGVHDRPNAAAASWPSAPSLSDYRDDSLSLDDDLKGLNGGASSVTRVSAALGDDAGTLGPATRSDEVPPVGMLAQPRARWIAGALALLSVASLLAVVVTRDRDPAPTAPAAGPARDEAEEQGSPAPGDPDANPEPALEAPMPSATVSATASAAETAPPVPRPVVRPRHVKAPKTERKEEPKPPPPSPKPASKDGLDLFDQRF